MVINKSKYTSNYTHGHTANGVESPTYVSWRSMKVRCLTSRPCIAKLYKDRGIKVCKLWLKFENFIADMGERPDGYTLDRIDNDKGYEPGNCRWASTTEQARNQRRSKLNETSVERVFGLRRSGLSQYAIATDVGVSQSCISLVLSGKRWVES